MKVTLDLDALLGAGSIDQLEYDKLRAFSREGTSTLAFNILVAFGVVAVAGATLALLPTALTAVALGAGICAAGLAFVLKRDVQWHVLAVVCVVSGALLFGGGIVKLGDGSIASFLAIAVVFAAAAIVARSGLLAALAVLALSCCLGARTGYLHAMYFLGIEAPLYTILVFSALAALLHGSSSRIAPDYRAIATAATRTSVFLVNFGFWIASLWGDRALHPVREALDHSLWSVRAEARAFAVVWALVLLAAGIFGWKSDRRWLVNVAAVFAAVDFYTQWFEWLGATPASVLIAGLAALALAIALKSFNRKTALAA
jgi:iron complex transport system permease protein